jgi:hypothetical protein
MAGIKTAIVAGLLALAPLAATAAMTDDEIKLYCSQHPGDENCRTLRAVEKERRALEEVRPAFERACNPPKENHDDDPNCIGWTAWCRKHSGGAGDQCRNVPGWR